MLKVPLQGPKHQSQKSKSLKNNWFGLALALALLPMTCLGHTATPTKQQSAHAATRAFTQRLTQHKAPEIQLEHFTFMLEVFDFCAVLEKIKESVRNQFEVQCTGCKNRMSIGELCGNLCGQLARTEYDALKAAVTRTVITQTPQEVCALMMQIANTTKIECYDQCKKFTGWKPISSHNS